MYQIRSKKIMTNVGMIFDGKKKILDIGSGTGCIAEILKKNHEIKLIDIKNISLNKDFQPLIFDGENIPFSDGEFDLALLITVLHHTKNPDQLLYEAGRVSNKILIIEDIFSNRAEFYWTCFMDSLINFEILTNPHNNRTDLEWKQTFKKFGFKLEKSSYYRSHFRFKHAMYYLSS